MKPPRNEISAEVFSWRMPPGAARGGGKKPTDTIPALQIMIKYRKIRRARKGQYIMKDKITAEVFQRLVDLAALKLPAEESRYLRRELNNQLISIEVLESIPIGEDVQAASHGVPYPPERTPGLRRDEVIPGSHRDAIMSQAPETENGYIVVPDISQEELE
jgi:aspartyl/glutamyl-tRNA(Asn/Gln) amidotransferase C subunit